MVTAIPIKDLKQVLMSPQESQKDTGYMINGTQGESITVLSAPKNGTEYNKTVGFFNQFPGIVIFKCLYGQGILVLQRNDEESEAKEFKIVSLRAGVVAEVPALYGSCLVNVGKTFLVVLDNLSQQSNFIDTQSVKDKKGFCYYIIDKQGEVSFVKNPNYSFHPQIGSL